MLAAFKNVTASHRHAYAFDIEGGFTCWGNGAVPKVPTRKLLGDMLTMVLGNDTTCILSGSGWV
jgi:hypothetical protein